MAAPFDYTDNLSLFNITLPDGTVIDTIPGPFDFTGDTIELPLFGKPTFIVNLNVFGPFYQGVKGPRGLDTSGPKSATNPSG